MLEMFVLGEIRKGMSSCFGICSLCNIIDLDFSNYLRAQLIFLIEAQFFQSTTGI